MVLTEDKKKLNRVLDIYERFSKGEIINKSKLAETYDVSEKSIQRDIDHLNKYFLHNDKDKQVKRNIEYNKEKKAHEMINRKSSEFTNSDVFAIIKIILESRAFSKKEMNRILNLLICQLDKDDSHNIKELIRNEEFYYVPPKHNKEIVDFIWKISTSIKERNIVKVKYRRQDGVIKEHTLKPLGLVFNEYYFYLIAEKSHGNENYQVVFRVDRFIEYKSTNEKFTVSYSDKFKEGEFRKKIQFMYTGDLTTIRFNLYGTSLEAIFDRLPTARKVKEDKDKILIEAEVYWEGVKRWFLSQQEFLEVIGPEKYRNDMKTILERMLENYK